MEIFGKRAVVVGLGRSGVAAARLLRELGAEVALTDAAPREKLGEAAKQLEAEGFRIHAGGHDTSAIERASLIVVSPGVPAFPALLAAEARGAEVIGELELASRFVSAPIALIGGTNGKSTTTALVFAMLAEDGRKTFVGGNFGTPLAEETNEAWAAIVLEISSFQAERVPTLHARAHALLNITDDHLDRYPSFEAYAQAKGNPFERMGAGDVAVIPAGDALCAAQAARGGARVVTFAAPGATGGAGGTAGDQADVAVRGGAIVDAAFGGSYPTSLLRISGGHNLSNVCAAIAVARAMGATEDAVRRALAAFEGLGHRTAFVRELGGVRYYDDSKGTNVGATVAALSGLAEPRAVLIAGGRDKLGAYEPLVRILRERGRALVLIGEAAARIGEAARGTLPVILAGTMDEAVARAAELAEPGDAVLLSPACSSFDMFRDYKDRGDAFVRAVSALADPGGRANPKREERSP